MTSDNKTTTKENIEADRKLANNESDTAIEKLIEMLSDDIKIAKPPEIKYSQMTFINGIGGVIQLLRRNHIRQIRTNIVT